MLTATGRRGPQGSVLMLVPAGVLVLFVLGAVAVDAAVAFLAQRELTGAAAAAANDAVTAALSDARFYGGDGVGGAVEVDRAEARRVVARAIEARRTRGVELTAPPAVTFSPSGRQVCVALTGRVEYVFAKALPNAPRGTVVRGRAVATAVGPGADATVGGTGAAC